uniref:Uncharacterized protein n=1 Tax=Mucochytrium quahogii TaxID=96639 RepID=A0A7S2SNF2_9STRA|mmetsp:Transcript_9406/g.15347  ORF Transcript_9406/g.15347 Transcript_9406/m.15347 type:complete len:265 (+) Transcript_9406:843-1637(+)
MGTVVGGEDESNKTTCEIEELAGDAEVDRNGQDDQGDRDIGAGDGPVEEKEERSAIFETRLDLAKKYKEEGNVLYKEGRSGDALKVYAKGLYQSEFDEMQWNFELLNPHREMVVAVRVPLLLNSAACALKLKNGDQVVEFCEQVFKLEPDNLKALYRRGQAYVLLSKLEKAKEDFTKVAKAEPNDKVVRKNLNDVSNRLKREQVASSSLWQGKFTSESHERSATRSKGEEASEEYSEGNICSRLLRYAFSFVGLDPGHQKLKTR